MPDTIQVVRVDDVIAEGVGVLNGSILLVWDGQNWVPVDVIELTERTRIWVGDDPPAKFYISEIRREQRCLNQ